ncbi:MAG TPA: 1-acyl-sn-glycerol-3-phosphate acyltransferase [Gemmatimonadales bacterium]|nr:1-acyl-sn-glycerol-3-phosphate acyltransferase [Gemmatimonadales bacterium]
MTVPRPVEVPPAPAADPFDPGFTRRCIDNVLTPISEHYFRCELRGADRIPPEGPLILAANHSGNAFPHDGIYLDSALWRRDGFAPAAKFRTVYEAELSLVWWMRPFGLDNFWRRGGGVDMTFDNFERLIQRGDRILYFPEGVPGIGKGFNRRYQLQTFKTSFALLAARHRVPVYPVHIINAEWIHPFGYTFPGLDHLMQRLFKVPFLPLPIGILAIIFPWMWFMAFPAHLVIVVGEPIDVPALAREEGITDLDRPDRGQLSRVAAKVRRKMQAELSALVAAHGRRPWDLASLWQELKKCRGQRGRLLPWGWPLAFIRTERNHERPPARNRLHAILRDWDLIGFYLPFGWPLLSLARAFRRPPCGYRGLSRAEIRERQGNFLWKLCERPLPARESRTPPPVSGTIRVSPASRGERSTASSAR